MKRAASLGLVCAFLSLTLGSCGSDRTPTIEPSTPIAGTSAPVSSPTPTTAPTGETRVVTSADDDGPGTLRQLLLEAQPGDTIRFDPSVFPANSPVAIALTSELPPLSQGHLTLDASDSGVILDGSRAGGEWTGGLVIASDWNTIRGLQIVHFTGAGIVVREKTAHNVIGGDRKTGSGPLGQGNLSGDNADGIGLFGASGNTLIGNLIGTEVDGSTPLGNRTAGIFLQDGARENVIGPSNVIAFNGDTGVDIRSADSTGNTITRNSIHDNRSEGIRLQRGSGLDPVTPAILDFDLKAGTASGAACPACIVEVFSDVGQQGGIYAGSATADSNGSFTLEAAMPFNGPGLTATATGSDGSTGIFSAPTSGDQQAIVLQEGNSLPRSLILAEPSGELTDNQVGVSYAGGGLWLSIRANSLGDVFHEIIDLGAKRVDTQLYEIEPPIEWTGSETDIPPEFDQFIDDLADHDVAVNYVLHYWDKEGHARGEELSTPRFQTEEQIQDYLDYVQFIAAHFRGRIPYYTLWSEPDNCGSGQLKCVEPQDYTNLARQAIPVIRQADPQAKVATAPVVLYFARDYLSTLVASDVISQFDVISWHGLYDVTPNNGFYGNYYSEYASIVQKIKQTAASHGFQGEYWGTELTWCSEEFPSCHPADQPWGQLKTDRLAAKYYARGIVMERGLDLGVGLGGLQPPARWSYPAIRRLNTVMAGVAPADLEVEIQGEAAKFAYYGFNRPNGDKLLALWTDDAAIENDPGVNATLVFPGLTARKAMAIDVLNGLEQELVISAEDGNLSIRGLRVPDYPLIILIAP